jgi:hypothetical protein
VDTIDRMVNEMAEDIDGAIARGARFALDGHGLRDHYATALRQHPVEDVFADVRQRWHAQAAMQILPPTFPCDI